MLLPPKVMLAPGKLLDDLILLGLALPREDHYFKYPQSKVREFISELADCFAATVRASVDAQERSGDHPTGHNTRSVYDTKTKERAATPAGRAATTEGQ